MLSALRNSQKS